MGKSRSAVTNSLRLCSLEPKVAVFLERGEIEMGHARALLTLDGPTQVEIAETVVTKGLNVRQTEALVQGPGKPKKPAAPQKDTDTRRLEENLGMSLGQPVQIRHTAKGRGKLVISYNNLDELDGILSKMGYQET